MAVTLPRNIAIEPGDHRCEKPDIPDQFRKGKGYNSGKIYWICPECKSEWETHVAGGYYWNRKTGSSKEWKEAERVRLEKELADAFNAPPQFKGLPETAEDLPPLVHPNQQTLM